MLNDAKGQFATTHKHLELCLDSRLDIIEQIDNRINKLKEIIAIMKRRSLDLSRKILPTI